MLPQEMEKAIQDWARGKWWQPRALLWAALAYLALRYVFNPEHVTIFSGLNLGIHEGGHFFFQLLGNRFLALLGGTVFELAAPLAAGFMFYRQPDYFAVSFCGIWLGTSLMSVAVYCADARLMELPLVTPGAGEPTHDWNTMLGAMGLLPLDTALAFLFRVGAFVAFVLSLSLGARILQIMRRPTPASPALLP